MKTSLAIFIFSKNEDNGIFVKNQKYVGLHTQLYAYIFCTQKETSSLSPRHDQFLSLGWVQHWFGFFSFGTKPIEFGGCESDLGLGLVLAVAVVVVLIPKKRVWRDYGERESFVNWYVWRERERYLVKEDIGIKLSV